jgi:hypothetical protein
MLALSDDGDDDEDDGVREGVEEPGMNSTCEPMGVAGMTMLEWLSRSPRYRLKAPLLEAAAWRGRERERERCAWRYTLAMLGTKL